MKLIISFLLALLFPLLSYSEILPNCPSNSSSRGGKCFNKEDKTVIYTEDDIYQLNFKILYSEFDILKRQFIIDSLDFADLPEDSEDFDKYRGFEIAGFCFIPIANKNISTSSNSPPKTIVNFSTEGLRVVLALWKPVVTNDIRYPDEIAILGYEALKDALTINTIDWTINTNNVNWTPPPSQYNIDKMLSSNITAPFPIMENADKLKQKTREFDLVFLDIETFEDLATSNRFYPDDVSLTPDEKGLKIERSYMSINSNDPKDTENPFEIENYRSLLFKPIYPTGTIVYDSETAVAYSQGYACPPYWRDPVQFNLPLPLQLQRIGKSTLKGMIYNSFIKTKVITIEQPRNIFEEDWFKLLIFLIIILIIIILAPKPPENLIGQMSQG